MTDTGTGRQVAGTPVQATGKAIGAGLLSTLALLMGLASFGIDLYLPAFPVMTTELSTTATGVQLSLTAFLIGAVAGQLVFGPWSDRAGRVVPLVFGALGGVIGERAGVVNVAAWPSCTRARSLTRGADGSGDSEGDIGTYVARRLAGLRPPERRGHRLRYLGRRSGSVANNTQREARPWIAFAAGAVAMLALALLWFAWMGRDEAELVARAAVAVAEDTPELPRPQLPQAPRIPDAPTPMPK